MAAAGYLMFLKKMWYAPLIWAIVSAKLCFAFPWSVLRSGSAHLSS